MTKQRKCDHPHCPGDEGCPNDDVCVCGSSRADHETTVHDHIFLSVHDHGARLMEGQAEAEELPVVAAHDFSSFQNRVHLWAEQALSLTGSHLSVPQRSRRFLEEATELVQAAGLPVEEARLILETVYGKPVGDLTQEAGAAAVTLAALCTSVGVQMTSAAEAELRRINSPEMITKTRAKDQMMFVANSIIAPHIPADGNYDDDPPLSEPRLRAHAQDVNAKETIAQALCGADGNGFLIDCTPTQREAYMIRATAVLDELCDHVGPLLHPIDPRHVQCSRCQTVIELDKTGVPLTRPEPPAAADPRPSSEDADRARRRAAGDAILQAFDASIGFVASEQRPESIPSDAAERKKVVEAILRAYDGKPNTAENRRALVRELSAFDAGADVVDIIMLRIRTLYDKLASSPLGMTDPWERRAEGGKPLLYGGRRGLLAYGTIATWDEFDLIVAVVNELPLILEELRRRPVAPKINVTLEHVEPGLIGSRSLEVLRVEREDDGSLTAICKWE